MKRMSRLGMGVAAVLSAQALAQPTVTSLGVAGGGAKPVNVTNPLSGTIYIGSPSGYWTLNGSTLAFVSMESSGGGKISEDAAYLSGAQLNDGVSGGGIPRIFGNTASSVSPVFRNDPPLIASTTQPAATEFVARRFNRVAATWQGLGGLPITGGLHVFGSSSSGSTSGAFLSPLAMSSDGRFLGGQGYSCQYSNSTGNTITASTFRWRPWIWDAQANAGAGGMTVLPTPFNTTSGTTWRRRDGIVLGISTDGAVVLGVQNHGSSVGLAADPDGARPVVWRWNSSTSQYDFSFLPGGDNGAGQYYTASISAGTMHMNGAGTIIVGRSLDTAGNPFIAKWVWNSGTNSWDAPINLGYSLAAAPSWLPAEITACSVGPVVPSFTVTGMSDDGNTVLGYSEWKCGGGFPMRGGWIWKSTDPVMRDWYDYLNTLGVPGIAPGGPWGPIGENGDNTKHQPVIGYPVDVSPDGNIIVGFHSANQMIPGAPPWILQLNGGPTCVAPVITLNPSNVMYSRCSFGSTLSSIILNAAASGTPPFTYQWSRNGTPISDGTTVNGSVITGATTSQIRIASPTNFDAGSYTCTITGCSGNSATTTAATVQVDAAVVSPPNDTCAGATAVGEGTFNFNPCGAYVNEGASNCSGTSTELADVWYQYTPTFTGEARFQTCASGFDTTLQVLSGCGGGVVACNNDVGARGLAGLGSACSASRAVILRLPVTAGVPVWVRVGCLSMPFSNSGTSGALVISQAPATPSNDLCANATVVELGTFAFNLSEATDDFDFGTDSCSNPVDSATSSNRDVWFRFTSACGGVYSFTTCGLASPNITNPMLHLMTPDCSGTALACDDNTAGCAVGGSNQAQITGYAMAAGETVVVRVSQSGAGSPGTNVLSGTGQLNISGTSNCGACCSGSTCTTTLVGDCTGSFQGAGTACGPVGNPTTCCPANYNGVGGVTVQDIFDFLAGYFTAAPQADFNHSGSVSVQDIFDFLAAYFTGCN